MTETKAIIANQRLKKRSKSKMNAMQAKRVTHTAGTHII
jgi:hypothetical protein